MTQILQDQAESYFLDVNAKYQQLPRSFQVSSNVADRLVAPKSHDHQVPREFREPTHLLR